MIFSIIAVVLIFGYAGWTVYRYVQKSKEGKCAGCSLAETKACGCGDKPAPMETKPRM